MEVLNLQRYLPTKYIEMEITSTDISHNTTGSSPAISIVNLLYMNYTCDIVELDSSCISNNVAAESAAITNK